MERGRRRCRLKERKEARSLSLSLSLSSDREDNADLVPLLTTKLETTTRRVEQSRTGGERREGMGGRRRLSGEERERGELWQVSGGALRNVSLTKLSKVLS